MHPDQDIASALARLRTVLSRALAGGDDPYNDPAALADLSLIETQYQGKEVKKIAAFTGAIRHPSSIPGVSRAVVLARGQRFLLSLAMEVEDAKEEKKPRHSKTTRKQKSRADEAALSTPFDPALLTIKGIGPKTASRLASRGITSPLDLLFLLPGRYEDRRKAIPIADLKPGMRAMTTGTITKVSVFGRPWRRIMQLQLEDNGATLSGMWFSNQRPRSDRFKKGEQVYLAGLVSQYKGGLQIAYPVVVGENDQSDRIGRVIPVYPQVPGVAGRTVEKAVGSAARSAGDLICDPLPPFLLKRHNLLPLADALHLVHLPPFDIPLEALDAWVEGSSPAHQRLVYDEFFFIQLALGLRRKRHVERPAPQVEVISELSKEIGDLFHIVPTNAQGRVINEITNDMARPHPMQRLLQGDVGSGKTLVALSVIVAAVRSGLQTALMAPTEILAEQHMRTLFPALERLNIRAALFIGQARTGTRKKNLAALERGGIDVAIGTHALIQESVQFSRLGLAVVDEQHRFGVSQRLGLVGKGPDGSSPHLLVMTATPIPRTLALTVHGDLDVSVLDELPPGRTKVDTTLWSGDQREAVWKLASKAMKQDEQVYIVCPIIEESKVLDVRAAEVVFEALQKRFGPDRTGLLHGRLSAEEKEKVMGDFVSGRILALVTTTVIEVGVDVPNATVMVIEGAERFGLAQLHQLRGRVGRSHLKSSCHLIADPSSHDAHARLDVLCRTNDGFEISEADLEIRGPGELYGRRQAGLPGFRFGHLIRDSHLLHAARKDVDDLLGRDPDLNKPDSVQLKEELARRIMADQGPVGEEAG